MSVTLWNSRFSVTLVRQHATILTSTTTLAANSLYYTINSFQPQQRRNLTKIMKPANTALSDKGARRTSQQSGRNPTKNLQAGRNSLESSTSDTGVNVPPFNHPHCDRQAMYQQPVRKVKPLRGKPYTPKASQLSADDQTQNARCFYLLHSRCLYLTHTHTRAYSDCVYVFIV